MAIRTDYQTVLEIDTATPISEGKMRADAGDLRVFGDAAHTEVLDFYVDPTTINTTATRVHIKQDLPTGRYHPGIIQYWPMDDAASPQELILGATETPTNTPTNTTGQVGGAIAFNGSSQYIAATENGAILDGESQASIEAWAYTTAIGSETIFAAGFSAGSAGKFQIGLNGTGKIFWQGRSAPPGEGITIFSGLNTVVVNTWYHIVATVDLAIPEITLYLNGEFDSSTTTTNFANAVWSGGGSAMNLGANNNATDYFSGSIDNVALYKRVLTADEVRSSYLRGQAGKQLQEPTPSAAWTFNSSDNAGSEVVDLVSGINGTLVGDVSVGQSARVGQGFAFNRVASTGYVNIADDALLEPHVGVNGTSTWAFSFTRDGENLVGNDVILAKVDSANDEFAIDIFPSGKLRLAVASPTSAQHLWATSDIPLPVGVKIHITCVYSQSEVVDLDVLKIYFDGVLVPRTITNTSWTSGTNTITSGTSDVQIGHLFFSGAPLADRDFSGIIDDMLWDSSALSDAQISTLANRSKQGLRPDLTSGSPLFYWSLDNRDIGISPQSISSQDHVTSTNNVLAGKPGPSTGQSFEFDGTSSELRVPDSATFDAHAGTSGVMTLTAWVKPTAYTAPQSTICSKVLANNDYEFFWRVTPGGAVNFQANNPTVSAFAIATSIGSVVPLDTWTFVTTVYDASLVADTDDMIKHYVNGQLIVNDSSSNTGSYTAMTSGPSQFEIGVSNVGFSAQQWFDGNIGNVEYYDQTLSAEQITDLYHKGLAGGGTFSDAKRVYVTFGDTTKTSASSAANTFVREITGLVHAYKFDETTGSTVSDASGSDSGTVVGGVLVENGITGLARNTNQEGVVDFTTQNIPTGDATVLTRFRTTTADQVLWSNYDGYADNAGSALEITSTGVLQFRHSVGAGSDNALATGTTLIDDGQLHTVVVTKDDANVNVYLDGYTVEATDTMVSTDVASAANYRAGGYREEAITWPSGREFHFEADGYTALDSNGGVIIWEDIVEASNDLTQLTVADRPTYLPEGIGGRPAIQLSGNNFMSLSTPVDLSASDFTLFLVMEPSAEISSASASQTLLTENPPVVPFMGMGFGDVTGALTSETFGWLATNTNRGFGDTNGTVLPGGQPVLFRAGLNGTTKDIAYDGSGVSVTTHGTVNSGTSQSLGPFNQIGHGTGGLKAKVSAIILFNRKLTEVEDNQVERYLALKYNTPNANVTGITRAKASYDEIRVFNRVLTLNEIEDLAANYGDPVGSRVQVRKRNDPEPVLNTDL